MKRMLASIVVLVGVTGTAWAQNEAPVQNVQLIPDNGPQQPGLIACSYNANGQYMGADSAPPNAQPGLYQAGSGWTYNIAAPDGRSCPPTKPNG